MIDFKSRYLLAKEYDTPEVDRIYTLSNNSSLFSDPEAMAEFSKMFFPATNHPYDRKLVIPSDFDDNQIALYVYYPDKRPEGELPVVYYIHGSGYLVGTADMFGTELKRIANESEVAVVSVEYRLAVKAPFPADIHDCVSGLRYLFSHGKDLGIDSNRVVLMGPSTGGGLTARLALYNRNHVSYR
ncbi:MAG: alpha/beta hydrolase [Muribaculaceae bacterium]|nr:alpha/beta hydrolase [Muribaculaceae bacterium]MDE7188910.1 alpha/beta hydrolase [Muribaculaceae bacterium]